MGGQQVPHKFSRDRPELWIATRQTFSPPNSTETKENCTFQVLNTSAWKMRGMEKGFLVPYMAEHIGGKFKPCQYCPRDKNRQSKGGKEGKEHRWISLLVNQNIAPSRSVLTTLTGSSCPGAQAEVFLSPPAWSFVTGDAREWNWDLLHAKQRLFSWATAPPGRKRRNAGAVGCLLLRGSTLLLRVLETNF